MGSLARWRNSLSTSDFHPMTTFQMRRNCCHRPCQPFLPRKTATRDGLCNFQLVRISFTLGLWLEGALTATPSHVLLIKNSEGIVPPSWRLELHEPLRREFLNLSTTLHCRRCRITTGYELRLSRSSKWRYEFLSRPELFCGALPYGALPYGTDSHACVCVTSLKPEACSKALPMSRAAFACRIAVPCSLMLDESKHGRSCLLKTQAWSELRRERTVHVPTLATPHEDPYVSCGRHLSRQSSTWLDDASLLGRSCHVSNQLWLTGAHLQKRFFVRPSSHFEPAGQPSVGLSCGLLDFIQCIDVKI